MNLSKTRLKLQDVLFVFLLAGLAGSLVYVGVVVNATRSSFGSNHWNPPESLQIINAEFISRNYSVLTVQNRMEGTAYVQSIYINGINATLLNNRPDVTSLQGLSLTNIIVTFNDSFSAFTSGQMYTFNITTVRGTHLEYETTYNAT